MSHALADRVVAALRLTLAKEVDRTITLGNDVRAEVAAALASVIDVELAAPQIRETITLRRARSRSSASATRASPRFWLRRTCANRRSQYVPTGNGIVWL